MRRGCSAPCRGGGCLAAPREPWLWLPSWFLKVSTYHLSPWCPSQFHLLVLLLPHLGTTLRLVVRSYTALEWFSLKWQGPPGGNIQGVLVCSYFTLLAAFRHGILTSCSTFSLASLLLSDFSVLVVFAWSYSNTSC